MNVKNFISSTMLSLIVILTSTAVYAGEAEPAAQVLYPTATQESFEGPEKYFTGEVMVQMLFPKTKATPFSGAYVTFQPGARTAWHLHPAGQHMIVTNGTALTGTRDGKVIAFHEGETVWCPAGIDHWHGATPDAAMTHLVITGSKGDQNVIWKEKVNAEVYLAAVNKVSKGKTTTMNKQCAEPERTGINPNIRFYYQRRSQGSTNSCKRRTRCRAYRQRSQRGNGSPLRLHRISPFTQCAWHTFKRSK